MLSEIRHLIDYTYLKEDSSLEIVGQVCQTAMANQYFGVCVYPRFVGFATGSLSHTPVRIITVISFPGGTDSLASKLEETRQALADGADEIDMVMNYPQLIQGQLALVREELQMVAALVHRAGKLIKVIVESGVLTLAQLKVACDMCAAAGVDFVKTSTGKVPVGAELDKVRYMRSILPAHVGIKASGGLKTIEDIRAFVAAGASRIGTSGFSG